MRCLFGNLAIHFSAASDSSGFIFRRFSAMVQWLSGRMYAQGPGVNQIYTLCSICPNSSVDYSTRYQCPLSYILLYFFANVPEVTGYRVSEERGF